MNKVEITCSRFLHIEKRETFLSLNETLQLDMELKVHS